MSPYALSCVACGRTYEDDGVRIGCEQAHRPSFLRTFYKQIAFTPDLAQSGMLRYRSWLPLRSDVQSSASTAVFQSDALNRALGAPNLWLAFNGYWPARGANLEHATFKDLEAVAVAGRFAGYGSVLVAASAGNTANALAARCSDFGIPLVVVVPESAIGLQRFARPLASSVKWVAISGDSTYDDAIAFARILARSGDFVPEGGAANVARRDGLGTTLLASLETIGALPDFYVQAIGSGATAIAVHETAMRVVAGGGYGTRLPRTVLVQNAPSAPVHESWQARSASLLAREDTISERASRRALSAPVLGVRLPPYETAGGLYDTLVQSNGCTVAVDNHHAQRAAAEFLTLEGWELDPAAAVSLAGLQSGLRSGQIERDATILLHLTGGGRTASLNGRPHGVRPDVVIHRNSLVEQIALDRTVALFAAA